MLMIYHSNLNMWMSNDYNYIENVLPCQNKVIIIVVVFVVVVVVVRRQRRCRRHHYHHHHYYGIP